MLDTVKINHVQHISFTQSRLTDAVSVILSELLSYEHPSNGRGGFPLFPPLTLSPLILYQLGKNKITLSSNSARTSSFQQPTRKDE